MFPKSRRAETAHRKRLREWEISIVVEILQRQLGASSGPARGRARILEFGSGDGFQIPHLQRLGDVVGSDVYVSRGVREAGPLPFVVSSIADAPFGDGCFDLVFSNHVIEHIDDLSGAFRDLRRIGKPGCLYALTMPTNLWLLFSVPAQYYNKFRIVLHRVAGIGSGDPATGPDGGESQTHVNPAPRRSIFGRILRFALPCGHGVHEGFIDCYRSFRLNRWRRLFSEEGFSIEAVEPLLVYGASEWPIVPTSRKLARPRFCASLLFILKAK